METKISEINSFTREVEIAVPWEDLKHQYEQDFKKFRAGFSQPGFRKGKVPVSILKRNYGLSLEMDFADKACNEYYKTALDELEFDPINRAEISELEFHEGEDLRFKAVFEVKPPVTLPDFKKKLKVTVIHLTPTETDYNSFIAEKMQQFTEFEPVDGVAEEGHILRAELQELDADGNAAEGKDPEAKYFLLGGRGFDGEVLKALTGRKKGDVVEVSLPVDGNPTKFEITIQEIETQRVPEINDDYAKKLDPEVETVDDLKDKVVALMKKQLDNEFDQAVQSKITDWFVTKSKVDVPTSWKENYLQHTIEDIRKRQKPGDPINEDEIRKTYSKSADDNLKWHLIREALLKAETLEVTDDEINARIESHISADEKEAKKIKSYYKNDGHRADLKEDIANEKLFSRLKEFTVIKGINKTTDEFREENESHE